MFLEIKIKRNMALVLKYFQEWQKSSYYKKSLERQTTLRRASSSDEPAGDGGNSSPTKIPRRNWNNGHNVF